MNHILKSFSFLLFYFVQSITWAADQSIFITSNSDESYSYHYTHTYKASPSAVKSIVDNNNAISQDP